MQWLEIRPPMTHTANALHLHAGFGPLAIERTTLLHHTAVIPLFVELEPIARGPIPMYNEQVKVKIAQFGH